MKRLLFCLFLFFGLPSTTDLAKFLIGHYGKRGFDEEIFLLKVFIVWFGLNSVAYILGGKFRFLPWTSLEEYEKISYITQGISEIKTCSKTSKETFLNTSDGSLNVGLNVILIDSLLITLFKKLYKTFFRY